MPETNGVFTLSFTETLDEYQEIYTVVFEEVRKNKSRSRRFLEFAYKASPAVVVFLLVLMLMGQSGRQALIVLLATLAFLGLMALLSGRGGTKGLPSSVLAEVSRRYEAKKCRVHELAIGPEKFVSRCPCGVDEREWNAMEAWYETDRQFLLKTGNGCYYSIAKRAISNEDFPSIRDLLVAKLGDPIKIETERGPRELMSVLCA